MSTCDDTGDVPRHPVREALDGVAGLLAGLVEVPLWSLDANEQADLVLLGYTRLAQLSGQVTHLVGEVDAAQVPQALGASSTAAWLRSTAGIHPATAKATVDTARGIRGGLSDVGRALAAGTVTAESAAVVVRAVQDLPAGVADRAVAAAETLLLDEAAYLDPVQLARVGRRVLELVDPDGADEVLARQLEREEARARRDQQLHLTPDARGGLWLKGHLGVEDAAALSAVLDPLSAPQPASESGPDLRSAARRRADALGEACRRLLDSADALPRTGGHATQVVVTMPLDTLLTGARAATLLPTGDPINPALARKLACDATIVPAVLGTQGQVLDVGRQTRLFTGLLRRALELRDRGCAFPGCQRPPAWCDGHHLRFWSDGGQTSLDNGVLLCGYHHAVIHRGDWTVRMAADGLPEFLPPAWIDPHRRPRRNPRPPPRR